MKPDPMKGPIAVDRLATPDEILAANLPFADPFEEYGAEVMNEIAAELGGYVRIPALELEASFLVEEWSRNEDTLPN